MRIQLASDLHLELLAQSFPGETLIRPAHGADMLVLAGDIAYGTDAIRLFADWPVPVLLVAGNHELYHSDIDRTYESMREKARGTSVRFMERDVVDFGGIRFLGCTLWTDYCLSGKQFQPHSIKSAWRFIRDHRVIRRGQDDRFTPEDALADHTRSRAWLREQLAKPYDGRTVVVTHHAPHPGSVHPRYQASNVGQQDALLNAAFVSDLTELVEQADLWLHGHVHDSYDYAVGRCKVIANPAGYVSNRLQARKISDLVFENPDFEFARCIDTEDFAKPISQQGERP
jgi:predicted phosphodiesterase